MRKIAIIGAWWCCTCAAQWNAPERVQLDGAASPDRHVGGLATPEDATDGVSANVLREQSIQHGVTSGTDQLVLTLTPAPAVYSPGMTLSIEPGAANTGAATLNVNGLGAIPLLKFVTLPLDSGDLRPGVPVRVVYDGSAFQLTSQSDFGCPAGFMAISRDACIETAVSDSASFFSANAQCVQRGARLCTMGEWYQACAMPGGIFSSVLAFEWVDHAANDSNYAKLMGSNGLGELDCKHGGLTLPLSDRAFRCCWDR